MILVDTSIWVDHFRRADALLAMRASMAELVQHPFVTGELMVGNLNPWRATVDLLAKMPAAEVLADHDLHTFVERHALMGTGVGFVDVHLLGSCMTSGHSLWTRDKRLELQAGRIGVATLAD